jgi:hypothetical protein
MTRLVAYLTNLRARERGAIPPGVHGCLCLMKGVDGTVEHGPPIAALVWVKCGTNPWTPVLACSNHVENYLNNLNKDHAFTVIELREFMKYPCHSRPQSAWCDHSGQGGFMGHTCFGIREKPQQKYVEEPVMRKLRDWF